VRKIVLSLSLVGSASLGLIACTGDDTNNPLPVTDAGGDATVPADGATDAPAEATVPPTEAGGNDAASDGATDGATDGPTDAGPVGPFLTLSYTFDSFASSAYGVFNPTTGAALGGLTYAQFGTNVSSNASPWVLEQANDLVLQMDPVQPWLVRSSWSVTEPPPEEAGAATYSDAFSVAEVGTKAYVALFTRDYIAVLDTSTVADGGAPLKSISLSQFVSDADVDHGLEAIAIFYDTTQSLVWVVLGNTNQAVSSASFPYLTCVPGFNPLVVAIDPTTDAIVSGKTYSLSGFDVYPASAVAFDQASDRLLAASQGCSDVTDESDGAVVVGPTINSYVEALSLATGTDTILLNPAPPGASALVYVDATHAFIQSNNGVNFWDPTQTTLGDVVPNAPDEIVWDGNGHLVGPTMTSLSDGGASFALIAVDAVDGGVTTLATNPFTPTPDPDSYTWEGIDIWPHP
jgi:hypothetical protein